MSNVIVVVSDRGETRCSFFMASAVCLRLDVVMDLVDSLDEIHSPVDPPQYVKGGR